MGQTVRAGTENRSEGRANVFLTATLATSSAAIPVRIRNLSSRGALIDAPSLPPVGAKVSLQRGSLSAAGELAWEAGGVGGLNFDDAIDVPRWVQRSGHPGQQQVDRLVAVFRRSEPTAGDLEDAGLNSLEGISAALDDVCERMAGTRNMPAELAEELLRLDRIALSLRQFAGPQNA
jgi:hypothetical protein